MHRARNLNSLTIELRAGYGMERCYISTFLFPSKFSSGEKVGVEFNNGERKGRVGGGGRGVGGHVTT